MFSGARKDVAYLNHGAVQDGAAFVLALAFAVGEGITGKHQ